MSNITSRLPVVQMQKSAHSYFQASQKRSNSQAMQWRRAVQIGFTLFNILIGIQFYRFVHAGLDSTADGLPYRPPGIEGWLPISGLMGVIDWFATGTLNTIHPAATVIVLAILVMAVAMRKAFCSWLCPVGFLSEYLANLGRWILKRKRSFLLPRWLDYPLLSLKYALLGFFLWAFVTMGTEGIAAFIASPYNRVSDVKMLLFFVNIGSVGLTVIGILMLGSVLIEGFWCRYLCPYGALLGLFSMFSPVKIRRKAETCIDCGKCDRVCPARLPVMSKTSIMSAECTGCMNCVISCPVKDTLEIGTAKRKLSPLQIGIIAVSIMIVFSLGARVLGIWESSLTDEEYRMHMQKLETSEYGHPGS